MRKTGKIIVFLLFVILLVISIAAYFITTVAKKEFLIEQFNRKTGLNLVAEGDARISLAQFKIKLTKLSLADPKQKHSHLVDIEEVSLSLKLKPLLKKKIEISEISLKKPIFFLENLRTYHDHSQAQEVKLQVNKEKSKFKINLKKIHIIDGTLYYRNIHNQRVTLEAINSSVDFIHPSNELNMNISLKKDQIKITSSVSGDLIGNNIEFKPFGKFEVDATLTGDLKGKGANIKLKGDYDQGSNYLKANIVLANFAISDLDKLNDFPVRTSKMNKSPKQYHGGHNGNSFKSSLAIDGKNIILDDKLILEQLRGHLNLSNDHLDTNFKFSTFDGEGDATVKVNYVDKNPIYHLRLVTHNLNVQKLAAEFPIGQYISGKLNLKLSGQSQGRSADVIKNNFIGQGDLEVNEGVIYNNNLAVINIFNQISGKSFANKIGFNKITATFNINHSILSNNDLVVDSDVLFLTGKGSFNIAKNIIHYRIAAKKLFNLGHKNSEAAILVTGSLTKPIYRIDFEPVVDILKDKLKDLDYIKEIKNLEKLFK